MKLLLDTHLLLWAAFTPDRLPKAARDAIADPGNEPLFSAASIWEVAIKAGLGREDFRIEAGLFRRGLLDNGYAELPITGAHAAAVSTLPQLHKDPFDRLLVAQAQIEGIVLWSADAVLSGYPGPIRVVHEPGPP